MGEVLLVANDQPITHKSYAISQIINLFIVFLYSDNLQRQSTGGSYSTSGRPYRDVFDVMLFVRPMGSQKFIAVDERTQFHTRSGITSRKPLTFFNEFELDAARGFRIPHPWPPPSFTAGDNLFHRRIGSEKDDRCTGVDVRPGRESESLNPRVRDFVDQGASRISFFPAIFAEVRLSGIIGVIVGMWGQEGTRHCPTLHVFRTVLRQESGIVNHGSYVRS